VAVSKGLKKVFTKVQVIDNVGKRGPGPNEIIYGDERLGFFGILSSLEFLNVVKFLEISNATIVNELSNIAWFKFIRKGKIYYVSDRPLISSGLSGQLT